MTRISTVSARGTLGEMTMTTRRVLIASLALVLTLAIHAPGAAAPALTDATSAAWADWNGDGQPDLYLARQEGDDRWLASSGGALRDLTFEAGLANQHDTILAAAVDLDGRGPVDLALLKADGRIVLLRNLGGGFEPMDDDRALGRASQTRVTVGGQTDSLGALALKRTITQCIDGIKDQNATSQCLKTASIGQLGKLHPLSQDLNVSVVSGSLDTPAFTVAGTANLELAGRSVAGAGDVNNDGIEDFVVGASGDDTLASDGGKATVYSGADASELFSVLGHEVSGRLGTAVAGVGDVNGDGYDDVAVGETQDNAPVTGGPGNVFILSGVDGSVIRVHTGDNSGDGFGSAVDAAGDVDGDGVGDLIVGAPGAGYGIPIAGYARVFSGADGSLLLDLNGAATFDSFGASVAGLGDADGDGVADVAVGAPREGLGGRVRVYSGADGSVLYTYDGVTKSEDIGSSLAGLGDIDGDGLGDLIAGGPFDNTNTGLVRVLSPASATILFTLTGDQQSETFGRSVAGTGDLTGDGVGDFLVGADAPFSSNLGYARLFSGADGSMVAEMRSTDPGDNFGGAVGQFGTHLLVGAVYADQGGTTTGSAQVYATRYVGMGTTAPGERLTVSGVVASLAGGFEFPDGTLQVDDAEGPTGAQGPAGPQGPQGPQGPPATGGVMSINNLANKPLSIAGSGAIRVSAAGSSVTLTAQPPTCTENGKVYSEGAICYFDIDGTFCSFGVRAKKKTCQADGTWQTSTSSQCFNPSPGPLCGI